jgi:hypothetical protein
MPDSPSVFIHVGLPKVASTTLQQEVFPNLRGVAYLGNRSSLTVEPLLRGEKGLISDENFVGGLLDGQLIEDFRRRMHRLSHVFPNAQLILGVRRHEDWLASLYKHYLYVGLGDEPFDHVFNCEGDGIIGFEDLTFVNYLDAVEDAFGSYPLVLTLDDLKDGFRRLVRVLCTYMGLPFEEQCITQPNKRGKGLSQQGVHLVRRLNKYQSTLSPRSMQYLRWGALRVNHLLPTRKSYRIGDEHVQCVHERLSEDWEEIQRIIRSQRDRLLSSAS